MQNNETAGESKAWMNTSDCYKHSSKHNIMSICVCHTMVTMAIREMDNDKQWVSSLVFQRCISLSHSTLRVSLVMSQSRAAVLHANILVVWKRKLLKSAAIAVMSTGWCQSGLSFKVSHMFNTTGSCLKLILWCESLESGSLCMFCITVKCFIEDSLCGFREIMPLVLLNRV